MVGWQILTVPFVTTFNYPAKVLNALAEKDVLWQEKRGYERQEMQLKDQLPYDGKSLCYVVKEDNSRDKIGEIQI